MLQQHLLQARCSACRPGNSVKALNGYTTVRHRIPVYLYINFHVISDSIVIIAKLNDKSDKFKWVLNELIPL